MSVINRIPAVETSGPADQGTQRIPAATVSDTSNPDIIGRIHSVETCGTVDGPGIRFIVFMQGCLMRCKYCHNRDTWDTQGGREVTVPELMKDLTSYRHFMNASGGGVTASGGEAMLQPAFITELFTACKEKGIHTCLDTNGFVRHLDEQVDKLLEIRDRCPGISHIYYDDPRGLRKYSEEGLASYDTLIESGSEFARKNPQWFRAEVAKVQPDDPNIAGIRVGQNAPGVVRLVVDLKQPAMPQVFTLPPVAAYRHRLVFDLYPAAPVDPLEALIAERLRDALPDLRLMSHCGGGNFKKQLKRADKSGAAIALILGETEVQSGEITIKYLRGQAEQQTVSVDAAIALLAAKGE